MKILSPVLLCTLTLVTTPAARTATAATACTRVTVSTTVPGMKPSVLVCPPPPWQ